MTNNPKLVWIITSAGIAKLPLSQALVGAKLVKVVQSSATAVAGWGQRPSTRRSRALAQRLGLPFVALEDGFLRSYATGDSFPPLSVVLDTLGIYYDCNTESSLEKLLSSDTDSLSATSPSPLHAMSYIQAHGLSKYNHSLGLDPSVLRASDVLRVLVVDQTTGDMSVSLGGANAQTFQSMLAAAYAENPNATIYVKTHPEVSSGRKQGYLTQVQSDERTVVLREAINPLSLIKQMDKVYVVSSTMGFEALLAGKPVTCFGMPWYAGWGVTDDRCTDSPAIARRTRKRTVEELFAAAYIHYTRYLNPVTHQRGDIFDVMHWLVRQRQMAAQMHGEQGKGRVVGVGFRRWKAANLKPLLGLHSQLVSFVPNVQALATMSLSTEDTVVFWGATAPAGVLDWAKASGVRLLHIEDGFIRSVGLGSDLIAPRALVLDERGIYFDATRPSDLEHLLNEATFSTEELDQARHVRDYIVSHQLTKYNLEPLQPVHWPHQGRRVLLVPGQVEDDASIRLGCTHIKTNIELLAAVRAANPDAFIVYKPHPDVISGNRKGCLALEQARRFADHVETGVSVISCIDACDELHTMTSLSGFDALLRAKRVVTYGQPFYAGWGLTTDLAQQPLAFARRQRVLTLDELVAGVLLRYPIYWDPLLKGYTTCEAVCRQLVAERDQLLTKGGLDKLRLGWWRRQLRKLRVLWGAYVA